MADPAPKKRTADNEDGAAPAAKRTKNEEAATPTTVADILAALDLVSADGSPLPGGWNGQWFGSGDTLEVFTPATGEKIAEVAQVTEEEYEVFFFFFVLSRILVFRSRRWFLPPPRKRAVDCFARPINLKSGASSHPAVAFHSQSPPTSPPPRRSWRARRQPLIPGGRRRLRNAERWFASSETRCEPRRTPWAPW